MAEYKCASCGKNDVRKEGDKCTPCKDREFAEGLLRDHGKVPARKPLGQPTKKAPKGRHEKDDKK